MKQIVKKMLVSVVALAMALSVPYVAKQASSTVKADDYVLTWSDEFDGTSLNGDNWNVEENGNGGGNDELQYYLNNTKNIEVSNGTLKIHALKESYGGKQYTSGRITTQNKKTFLYGKVEARMKLPRFQGAWPAFWMLGNNIGSVGWPKCGEMDIMEAINNDNNVYANLHWSYQNTTADTKGSAYNVGDRTAWHVYGMEWDEKTAKFYVDGNVYQTYAISDSSEMQEFREKQFIILNLAIGGRWPGWDIDNTAFPDRSTFEIDYVRVYQKKQPVTSTYVISEGYSDVVDEAKTNYETYACGNDSGWAGSATIASQQITKHGATVTTNGVGTGIWALQMHSPQLEAVAGATYDLSTTLKSSVNKQIRIKVRGNDSDDAIFFDETFNLVANQEQTINRRIIIPSSFDGYLKIDYGFGRNDGTNENIAENTNLTMTVSNTTMSTYKKTYGVVVIDDGSTTKNNQQTTKKNNTPVATTTNVSGTDSGSSGNDSTSVSGNGGSNSGVLAPAKVKVAKATKKKSAKKLVVKIKKVADANGYSVSVFKTKKNAKKFKKVLVTKKVKKNTAKISIKNKKLKSKKKLFVRVRAYKLNGTTPVYGAWSAVKKVKIK